MMLQTAFHVGRRQLASYGYWQTGLVLGGTVLGFVSSSMASSRPITLCDDDKDSNSNKFPDVIRKDSKDGSIDWSKTVSQLSGPDFWDEMARAAAGKVQGAIDTGIPTQVSYGFVSGYCSGIALKKVGKVAATVFGLGFVSLQTLAYYGYIEVDHSQIQKSVENMLDLNEDGRIDSKDKAVATAKLMEILQFGLPAGSGFTAGFVSGVRSG